MTTVLVGILLSILTELSEKNKRLVIIGLALVAGIAYTALQRHNPDLLQQAIQFTGEALAISQAVYLLFYNK